MLFRQFVDDDLGCASYLVGDEAAGEAVLVDPAYAIEQYLEEAERSGVRIVRVLETHTHADHVSGHGRLALEHGIPVSVHEAAGAAFPHDALDDGAEISVGTVTVRVVHTPGHRPEHCAFEVVDQGSSEPALVLTGDSLFVGDAGRPDLAVDPREGAQGLFHSLQRLLRLPDDVSVFPGHVAGSLCGASMSSEPSTTIGFERRFNHRLQTGDEQEFVSESLGSAAPRPPNMERIVELNRGPFVGRAEELSPAPVAGGALVLDVRPVADFASGHVPGALNVPVSGSSFATKAAFVLLPDDRVVLHGSSDDEVSQAARGLRAVGFLDLAGYLEDTPLPERLEPVDLDELERLLAEGSVELVDVREKDERDEGYIAGSRNVPYRLLRSCRPPFEEGARVVTICESGARAAIAASVLSAAGISARPVVGGVGEWESRGGRTVEFRRCGT